MNCVFVCLGFFSKSAVAYSFGKSLRRNEKNLLILFLLTRSIWTFSLPKLAPLTQLSLCSANTQVTFKHKPKCGNCKFYTFLLNNFIKRKFNSNVLHKLPGSSLTKLTKVNGIFSLHWFQVELEKVFEKDLNNNNFLKMFLTKYV